MHALVLALSLLAAPPTPRAAAAAPPAKKGVSLDPAVAADPDSVAKLQAHLYHSAPMELAATTKTMLEGKGFTVPEQKDPLTFFTEWQADKKGSGRARYVVRIVAMSAAAARVEFVREHDGGGDVEKSTDLDAASALLMKLEPDAAAELKEGAPDLRAPTPPAAKPSRK